MTTQESNGKFNVVQDPAERIFNLFEGSCPDCGKDVKTKEHSGTKFFLRQHPAPEGAESNVWSERYGSVDCGDEIGCVIFICPDGHEHYVGYGRHGDWMC